MPLQTTLKLKCESITVKLSLKPLPIPSFTTISHPLQKPKKQHICQTVICEAFLQNRGQTKRLLSCGGAVYLLPSNLETEVFVSRFFYKGSSTVTVKECKLYLSVANGVFDLVNRRKSTLGG